MTNINEYNIIEASIMIYDRTTKIDGTYHGYAWLADKIIRYFCKEPSAESINIDVILRFPNCKKGYVTIHRDGFFSLHTYED